MRILKLASVSLLTFGLTSCIAFGEGHCPEEDYGASEPNKCYMIPDAGPCEAKIEKYYYDAVAGKCKAFDWGGCRGTVPFHTMQECEDCAGQGITTNTPNEEGIGAIIN